MRRAASSSALISDRRRADSSGKPPSRRLCRSCAPVLASALFLLLPALFASGCSGSSPRFRSAGTEDTEPHAGDEYRFAARIRTEESREDDRKVDLAAFRKNLSGHYKNATPDGINRDNVLLDMVSFLGVPYKWGGTDKQGFDCSGFTSVIYGRSLKIPLPRTANGQYRTGKPVASDDLQFGDLVFFETTGSGASHVGIYIEDDLFAHASVTYGVTISSLESTYYRTRYLGAKRVVR